MTNYVYYNNGNLPAGNGVFVTAESANGTSWSSPTPITIDGAVDPNAADADIIVLANGTFLLSYTTLQPNSGNPVPGVPIYTATSTDGINFTNAQPAFTLPGNVQVSDASIVQLANGSLLMSVGNFGHPGTIPGAGVNFYISTDGQNYTPTGVTLAGDISPSLLLLSNGDVRLYESAAGGIGSFISTNDGQTWTQEAGLRLTLPPGSDAGLVSVVQSGPSQWLMVYQQGPGAPSVDQLVLATSTDGLNFTITQAGFVSQGGSPDIIADPAVAISAGPLVSSLSAVTDTDTPNASTGHLVTITMTTSEAVTVTGTPTLQLNDNEVAAYTGGSGSNTLTFAYTVQPNDITADLQVTGLHLPSGATIGDQAGALSGNVTGDLGIQVNNAINDAITELYVGYYNRAPDTAGETYWVGQLQGGMSLSAIAQSYSVQPESTNLYPFLASPNTASTAAVQAFVTSVYENLFNRAPDTAGENFWVTQLQTGASTVGGAIINIISGAQLNDLATINNKVIVGDYFDTQIFNNNVQFSASVASAALNAVTFNTTSITTAEAIVNAYVATAPHAEQAVTASQTEVNLVGVSPSHELAVVA